MKKAKALTKAEQAKLFTAQMKSVLSELRRIPNLEDWKVYIHVGDKEFRFKYIGPTKRQGSKEFAVIKRWFKSVDVIHDGCKPVQVYD